ncbi:tRNA (adenosine(37)-N6)-threonylcarbamoyltransferase complex ATPase subunit type 1 TsaE [Patescibacteria group bacterium]|nr:tRNA (adenosine(37)-N6)-threonylcarbamoyltransferase complex ATPase subunit type 1 TsaE [Patescibacteria group bacterium]MBU4162035.1 tRNA (adenosine(37)-N6)-threonylcarbamoyltransferase complex ATPase subunit type 1 TsaE [Patescibacteria group bacterium]
MRKKIQTNSHIKTQHLAENIAKKCLKTGPDFENNQAMVFAMHGDLGSGKTTFTQGFAKGLGVVDKILSPTFVILKKFQIPNSEFQYLYHIDCYRINDSREIQDLGFKEIISDPKNIIIIEWAEKIEKALPKYITIINFEFKHKNIREIIIKSK